MLASLEVYEELKSTTPPKGLLRGSLQMSVNAVASEGMALRRRRRGVLMLCEGRACAGGGGVGDAIVELVWAGDTEDCVELFT